MTNELGEIGRKKLYLILLSNFLKSYFTNTLFKINVGIKNYINKGKSLIFNNFSKFTKTSINFINGIRKNLCSQQLSRGRLD